MPDLNAWLRAATDLEEIYQSELGRSRLLQAVGQFACFSGNMGTDRIDAFLVEL